jgi:hypothetical protein
MKAAQTGAQRGGKVAAAPSRLQELAMRFRFATVPVILACAQACGGSDATSPPNPPGPPVSLSAFNGVEREGKWGAVLGTPLGVRVSDAAGRPVPNVVVDWAVTSGGGSLESLYGDYGVDSISRTGADGVALRPFWPTLGRNTVAVSIPGLPLPAVEFTIITETVVITLDWFGAGFLAPSLDDVTRVPLGTAVEFYGVPNVYSVAIPEGGEHFSHTLDSPSARFRITPNVVGDWIYATDTDSWVEWQSFGWCAVHPHCKGRDHPKATLVVE